jgi:hypothetical protein
MTRKMAPVDPESMLNIFRQTHGSAISRMQQTVAVSSREGVSLEGYEARQQRIRAFADILREHPRLQESYSEKALVFACALCELIEPPMSLVEADEAAFDLEKFEQEASRAEL